MPPSDLSGRAGRCGVQILPSLNSGLPLSISADSASTVAVTAPGARFWASSSEVSMPATGLRPARARSFGSVELPIEVPRALRLVVVFDAAFSAAALSVATCSLWARAAFSTLRRCFPAWEASERWLSMPAASASDSSCLTQSATEPVSGAPSKAVCGASSKPPGVVELFWDFFGVWAMARIWRMPPRKKRGGRQQTGTNMQRQCDC